MELSKRQRDLKRAAFVKPLLALGKKNNEIIRAAREAGFDVDHQVISSLRSGMKQRIRLFAMRDELDRKLGILSPSK